MGKRKRLKGKKQRAQNSERLAAANKATLDGQFTQPCEKAWLLIEHPHSYRQWNIVGCCDVPGFFYLESRFRLNPGEQPAIYTSFEICLHESQFGKD